MEYNEIVSGGKLGGNITSTSPTSGIELSEIKREMSDLDKAIQESFELARQLSKQLEPVCLAIPPQNLKDISAEDILSPLGADMRRQRRSVQDISSTLRNILGTLKL